MRIYVSKCGDDSDGTSWKKAFHTIQGALLKIPDNLGGHQVIIRPDTYAEANLYPAYKGAPGAYNHLVGDSDGALGSGTKGWVVIDSGAPEVIVRSGGGSSEQPERWVFKLLDSGNPADEYGMKSVDWWGPFKCDPYFSCAGWDRWVFRNLYSTGSEGGIGWDMTCEKGCEFSALVENCIGIGRFAGAGVAAHVGRKEEPVLFRDSWFLNLDTWGDHGAAYVRGENPTMPEHPDAVFENCTLISPRNALKSAWPGCDEMNTRVKLNNCRLIVLNFSQPRGEPSTGIIRCDSKEGRQLHVDLKDCTLMGYKVFGAQSGEISYTVRGRVAAYVEYEQAVPPGFERLRYWPVEIFNYLCPPDVGTPQDCRRGRTTTGR